MDIIDALDETFRHAHRVIANVQAEQLGDKTPCDQWTVRDLLEHQIGVVVSLGAAAAGEAPGTFVLGDDPAEQFAVASAASLAAWRRPGVLDGIVVARQGPGPGRVIAGINLLDTATHAWDLAVATGQDAELPAAVAAAALEASHLVVTDELRVGRFDPERSAPVGASVTGQLVAFLGRSV